MRDLSISPNGLKVVFPVPHSGGGSPRGLAGAEHRGVGWWLKTSWGAELVSTTG